MGNKSEATRVSNIGQVRQFFADNVLPHVANGRPDNITELRQSVIEFGQTLPGVKITGAAAMYNTCRREAVEQGLAPADAFARPVVVTPAESDGPDLSLPWATVNKESREITGTYPSRSAAQAAKVAADTVKKTADAQAS